MEIARSDVYKLFEHQNEPSVYGIMTRVPIVPTRYRFVPPNGRIHRREREPVFDSLELQMAIQNSLNSAHHKKSPDNKLNKSRRVILTHLKTLNSEEASEISHAIPA